jgi:hypothetical protein
MDSSAYRPALGYGEIASLAVHASMDPTIARARLGAPSLHLLAAPDAGQK